ncbi:TRAP transporter substrate-binding protein [Oricola thermophila]|uniref:TRAP transporter substrate-binding protein n=1 Tax=Oricola thermophila TaxID=2742145 RepID=A0A6N1VDK7_9HYPH|nr:TRAP transporter substrate-binding protein [Oricola thermophila]QKV19091.1 TRAP transporter substrate-binding protein [Oricola thermophila]
MKTITRHLGTWALCATAMTAFATGADAKTVLRFAHMNSPTHVVQLAGERLKAAVEERTKGEVEIALFPSGQLGSNSQVAEQISLGGEIIGHMGTPNLADYNPDYQVTTYPFMFQDFDELMEFMKTPLVRDMEKVVEEKNLKVMCYFAFGVRDLYTRETEVHSPEDMQGLKIREQPLPLYIELAKQAFTAVPTPLPWPEVYNALAVGVVDAAEAPPSAMLDQKHNEHVKYYMTTNHIHDVSTFTTSAAAMNALSDENRAIVTEETRKACDWITDQVKASYESDVAKVEASGVKIVRDIDRAAFAAGAAGIYKAFPDWTPGLYDRAREEVEKIRAR